MLLPTQLHPPNLIPLRPCVVISSSFMGCSLSQSGFCPRQHIKTVSFFLNWSLSFSVTTLSILFFPQTMTSTSSLPVASMVMGSGSSLRLSSSISCPLWMTSSSGPTDINVLMSLKCKFLAPVSLLNFLHLFLNFLCAPQALHTHHSPSFTNLLLPVYLLFPLLASPSTHLPKGQVPGELYMIPPLVQTWESVELWVTY